MDLLVCGRQIPDSASNRKGHESYFSCHALAGNRRSLILPMQSDVEQPLVYSSPSQNQKSIWGRLPGAKDLVPNMDSSDHARESAQTPLHTSARPHSERESNGRPEGRRAEAA